ncbi:MAG: MFS transporter [Chloroflexi bacterium]|nr:MFS transporter [Chloroflexota bacterium]
MVLPTTFASLQHRNYRLLWMGSLISSSGDWMDQIAFNWLVYDLTGSAVYLGLVNFCRMAPILFFTLIGGVVADRVERRRLMFTTQAVAMLLAFILALLVSTGIVQIWMVMLIAAGRGIMMSFNQPARQSLISELVPQRHLMNAIALNSATQNLTRVLGPAIGGLLIASVGVAGAFYLNAASFLAVLYGLALMQFGERQKKPRNGMLADLSSGVNYLRHEPTLRTLVILALVPMVFGMPYMTMLTVFAKDVLQVGSAGLGLLTASSSVGAVAGALFVASRRNTKGQGQLMLFGLVGFGVSLLGFSFSPWLWLSLPLLLGVGACQQIYMTSNNSMIQMMVSEEYRGRVLSTLFLNRGLVPLGTIVAGFGTALFSAQVGLGGMAGVLVLLALLAVRFAPGVLDLPGIARSSGPRAIGQEAVSEEQVVSQPS